MPIPGGCEVSRAPSLGIRPGLFFLLIHLYLQESTRGGETASPRMVRNKTGFGFRVVSGSWVSCDSFDSSFLFVELLSRTVCQLGRYVSGLPGQYP